MAAISKAIDEEYHVVVDDVKAGAKSAMEKAKEMNEQLTDKLKAGAAAANEERPNGSSRLAAGVASSLDKLSDACATQPASSAPAAIDAIKKP